MQFQDRISQELDELRRLDRFRILPDITARNGKHIAVNGQFLLNLSSNDYLGLGDDREMLAGYAEEFSERQYAMTSSSSRLLTGNHPLYDQLETALLICGNVFLFGIAERPNFIALNTFTF